MTAPAVPQFSYSSGAVRLPSVFAQRGGGHHKDLSSGSMGAGVHGTGCGTGKATRHRRRVMRKPLLEHIENLHGRRTDDKSTSDDVALRVGPFVFGSASCHAHVSWLASGMDPSADACCDAEAYACKRAHWHSDLFASALDAVHWQWSLHGSRFLEQHRRPAEAFALYNACISDNVDSASESRSVVSFLKEIGLPWPHSVEARHRHVLDVVLDLNINWGVQLWFQISLRRLPQESRHVPITCYAVAESRYESTLLPHRVASTLQQSGLVAVKVIFRDIKAAASRLIAAAAWMDEKARKEAVAIISSVTLEPWSALFLEGSRLASDEPTPAALAVATEEQWWPPPHRTVFDRWLDAARQHKLLTANWPLDDSLLQRHSRLLEYDAWWNSVHLDPSVVTGLMVDAGAPPPALYGSLGAVMAQAVVQALDYRVGTFLDHERKLRDWLSPASRRAFLDRAVCAEREDVLMGVAALGVLLEAYRTSVVNESAYYDVREFRTRLTPEMMLFVAFCRTRCTLGRGCNELVRHVTAYSRAFGCATRAVKCSFFGE
ncbi:hypothetical protein V5799_031466 [Amblyomma americanum]|uniref:Uncharacterized protein n=1 Tax=Amblyomma americanum TaxID=6943 RepID=A0AAQ4EKR5_AMBAM